jgi:hypothetical protein
MQRLDVERSEIVRAFRREQRALQLRYERLYSPIYERRARLVDGTSARAGAPVAAAGAHRAAPAGCSGVPGFWLRALKNHYELAEQIWPQACATTPNTKQAPFGRESGEPVCFAPFRGCRCCALSSLFGKRLCALECQLLLCGRCNRLHFRTKTCSTTWWISRCSSMTTSPASASGHCVCARPYVSVHVRACACVRIGVRACAYACVRERRCACEPVLACVHEWVGAVAVSGLNGMRQGWVLSCG